MSSKKENARPYRASEDELKAIDEAEASGIASHQEVEAAFAAFRTRPGPDANLHIRHAARRPWNVPR